MNREEWLKTLEGRMISWIEAQGHTYPTNTRVSCGFPKASRGRGNTTIGQCWSSVSSADNATEIFICPTQSDPMRVSDILLHEMIHATLGTGVGHKKPFVTLARALGLEGKATATHAGDTLKTRLAGLLVDMPPYPHAELKYKTTVKQATALLKVECPSCGYIARVTAKWLNIVGAPICPCNNEPMELR